MAEAHIYEKEKNTLRRTLEGKEIVLNLDSRTFYQLNGTGTFVLGLVNGKRQASEIAAIAAERFGITHRQALADVGAFLAGLEKEKIVRLRH